MNEDGTSIPSIDLLARSNEYNGGSAEDDAVKPPAAGGAEEAKASSANNKKDQDEKPAHQHEDDEGEKNKAADPSSLFLIKHQSHHQHDGELHDNDVLLGRGKQSASFPPAMKKPFRRRTMMLF
jgi:hypothetical protein